MFKIKFSVVGILLSSLAFGVSAKTADQIEQDGFYLAMESMNPKGAHYTRVYQRMIENKCKNQLSIDDLTGTGFASVVAAFEVSGLMERPTIHGYTGLPMTVGVLAADAINCDNYGAPFNALLSNSLIKQEYPKFSAFLSTWNTVSFKQQTKS
ncbi:hypothetical protein [Moritella sp. F3]|uniref:hypothetical protein n=1 Tax=Moritella sp. F3 TaxID=2718882 RepID=UPI0018E11401|nr:hypothetical protein [Moritella sp. F3]GIC77654.1 hypothetical protein FMO001_23810 [Moritella sp. F1]GIC82067.1 hypothetical protein FMO003_23480 [Moritella sp. F3]